MKVSFGLVLAAAFIAAGTGTLSAQVALEGVHWQVGRLERGRIVAWQDVRVLDDGPPKLDNRLRARLVLKNRAAKDEDGLLIRYSMTARIAPSKPGAPEGTWAIPFVVEERRVPKVGGNRMIEVPLDTGSLIELYLKRLSREGWWPDRIKIQVMMEPRTGATAIQTVEDVLEVHS